MDIPFPDFKAFKLLDEKAAKMSENTPITHLFPSTMTHQ